MGDYMPITVLPRSRADWLALREKLVITASRVGCLLTDHPYTSRLKEYEIAVQAAERDDSAINPDLADLGNDAELLMPIRAARVKPGLKLVKNIRLYLDPSAPLGGTPDFLSPDLIAEAQGKPAPKGDYLRGQCWQGKCVHPAAWRTKWQSGAAVPDWIMLQHQAEYALTGATAGGVLVLIRDAEWTTELLPIDPHPAIIEAIREEVIGFAEDVRLKRRPKADYRADGSWIMERAPRPASIRVIDLSASNSVRDAFARYVAANEAEKAAKANKDAAMAELVEAAGDAGIMLCGPYKLRQTHVAGVPKEVITREMAEALIGTTTSGRKDSIRRTVTQEAA
jgi:hypothetical protein